MKIIEAKREHIESIIELNDEVQKIHCDLFPDFFKETNHDELHELFSKWIVEDNFRAYIAINDGVIDGYLFCRIVRRDAHAFSRARSHIYIDQVCVTQQSRGKGVGKALVGKVVELARIENIGRIELDYWIKNQQAGQAFEALGFSAFNQKMAMNVE